MFNLNNLLWGPYNGCTMRAKIICGVVCVWSRIPHPLPSTCQPCTTSLWTRTCDSSFRLLVYMKRKRVYDCGKPESWTPRIVWVLLCPPERASVCVCYLYSLNSVGTVRKRHLLTVQGRLFVNARLIGPLECNAACDWLRVSCWPKVDSQRVGNAGSWKKFQLQNGTMRLPWVGLE